MSNTVAALWASIARTLVPMAVGWVITWAVSLGINLDDQFEGLLTAALTAAFAGAYYIVVRLLETYVTPKLGWLLGLAKAPAKYSAAPPAK